MNNQDASVSKLVELSTRISEGKITQRNVQKELAAIEKEYGNPYIPYSVEIKEKPWDIDYLKKLRSSVPFGTISKEYFLYMSEVADDVFRIKRIVKVISFVVGIVVAISLIILAQRSLGR